MKKGTWCGVGACVAWGLFPVYWKQLVDVPGLQLVSHRFIWSFVMLVGLVAVTGERASLGRALRGSRRLLAIPTAAVLIGINWFTFLWAVEAGFIVEASLGYFITPLVNVGLGVLLLGERLRPTQWVAIGLAVSGVSYLTFVHGSLPAVALVLAFTFGIYGLIKKTAPLGALHGLTAETGVLVIPAIGYLIYAVRAGDGVFLQQGTAQDVLLVSTGLVTIVPLLLFAWAVRRIPLSLMGILQYIAPTLQFIVGVMLYEEPFSSAQLVGFSLVWMALVLFGVEGVIAHRPQPVSATIE
ncbi:MAG: EamA family transporter RarD [Vicinamibacterales bacterium]